MIANAILVILAAYFLGSIPSAYLVGRLVKGIDMREVGDGRIGASFTKQRLGLPWGITVAFMDVSKGAIAVILAQVSDVPLLVVLTCGMLAVMGHNWSIFLGFKGGKGAATTFGVLAALMLWHLIIAMGILATYYLVTHNSTLATGIIFCLLPILLWASRALGISLMLPWAEEISPLLIFSPLLLSFPWLLKRPATARVESKED